MRIETIKGIRKKSKIKKNEDWNKNIRKSVIEGLNCKTKKHL
jgi:hypothetical protein